MLDLPAVRTLAHAALTSEHGQKVLGVAAAVAVLLTVQWCLRRRDDARAARRLLIQRQRMALEVLRPLSCHLCHGLSPRLIGVPLADGEATWVCDTCHEWFDPHGIAPEA